MNLHWSVVILVGWMLIMSGMPGPTQAYFSASSTTALTPSHSRADTESRVRSYFDDIPEMIEIARCESNFRQFSDSGNVLRGAGGTIGIFQFKESVHTEVARQLGHDLETIDGNLAYARYLYSQSGTAPWRACVPPVIPPPLPPSDTTELKIQLMQQLIVLLQELLKLTLAM